MATKRITEPAFNVELGNVLRTRHPRWHDRIDVESTGVFSEGPTLRPDIVVRHPHGMPVVIESEFAPARTAQQDARGRLGMTFSEGGNRVEQVIAVCVPGELKTAGQHELGERIEEKPLAFCVFSGTREAPVRWPATGWMEGSIDELADCIEQAALSEDSIARGMRTLELGIGQAASVLRESGKSAPDTLARIADTLHQKDGEQTSRMAMAILANAFTFHAAIAGSENIPVIDDLRGATGRVSKGPTLEAWRHILEINYWPIFKIASDILVPIRVKEASHILNRLVEVANTLAELGATSQHDLSGRMFQRLIVDRKFLATFYTLPSSSTLLAELAVSRLDADWSDAEAVASLRIADFACGTGALLNAAYGAVMRRHRRTGGDDRALHPRMIEHAIVGSDIMPAATHLTASVLSSAHPDVQFQNTSILTLPYGDDGVSPSVRLGALDLIESETTDALFNLGQERVKGGAKGRSESVHLPHRGFDLVIMNPPFTRPTNHKITDALVPSFAGFATNEDEQKAMSGRLRKISKPGMAGHGNAGLASNFIDIAHAKVKPGGVLALVLPASFLRGEAWSDARALFAEHYRDVVAISIAAARSNDQAFSADTGMAEVLIVATRKDGTDQSPTALFINLEHRPRTLLEAVQAASVAARIPAEQASGLLRIGSEENVGCWIRGDLLQTGCAGVRALGVAEAASVFAHGRLPLAHRTGALELPLVELGALGKRGLLHRDINGKGAGSDGLPRGPFDIEKIKAGDVPDYPTLWGHDAGRETRLIALPDRQGVVRPGCKDRAAEAWEKTASRLHFNLDFTISSQPLAACLTPKPSLGGRAWPNFRCDERRWEKTLALWANTTLGLIAFWWIGNRQQSGRAILTITRLPALTVLDARKLQPKKLELADSLFDEFAERELLPANEAWHDETRQALDRAVLIDVLGLPEDILEALDLLRRQWCAEPSVHGGKGTRPE